jgi:hypothetical protein
MSTYKVADKDNIFLINTTVISVSETDKKTGKIIKAGYKGTCRICRFSVESIEEINVRRVLIAHIISMHRDVWLNREIPLVESND